MLELGMRNHRADPPAAVLPLHAVQPRNATQVDQQRRGGEPQLHQRQQRVAAGQQLGLVAILVQHPDRLLERVRRFVIELGGDHWAPPFASWIAPQTRIGVNGMLMYVTPNGRSASMSALVTAAEAAIVPASPTPLAPSELTGDGVSVRSSSKLGSSAAVGRA